MDRLLLRPRRMLLAASFSTTIQTLWTKAASRLAVIDARTVLRTPDISLAQNLCAVLTRGRIVNLA